MKWAGNLKQLLGGSAWRVENLIELAEAHRWWEESPEPAKRGAISKQCSGEQHTTMPLDRHVTDSIKTNACACCHCSLAGSANKVPSLDGTRPSLGPSMFGGPPFGVSVHRILAATNDALIVSMAIAASASERSGPVEQVTPLGRSDKFNHGQSQSSRDV